MVFPINIVNHDDIAIKLFEINVISKCSFCDPYAKFYFHKPYIKEIMQGGGGNAPKLNRVMKSPTSIKIYCKNNVPNSFLLFGT